MLHCVRLHVCWSLYSRGAVQGRLKVVDGGGSHARARPQQQPHDRAVPVPARVVQRREALEARHLKYSKARASARTHSARMQ